MVIKRICIVLCGLIIAVNSRAAFESVEEHMMFIAPLLENQVFSGNVITVGNQFGCDFNSIEDAVNNASDGDMVRVTTGVYNNEVIDVFNKSISLVGGFANCEDAENNIADGNKATISSTDIGVIVSSGGMDVSVGIQNIVVDGATVTGLNVPFLSENSLVSLKNVEIKNGSQAVRLSEGNLYLVDSKIYNNSGSQSAIVCNNSSSMLLDSGTNVYNNSSQSDGGAIFLESGCTASIFSNTGVYQNNTSKSGAAISTKGNVYIHGKEMCMNNTCFGENDEPVYLLSNHAEEDGGALDIQHGGKVEVVNGYFLVNIADNRGGVAYLDGNAEFKAIGINNEGCWVENGFCNVFKDNKADFGGVIYLNDSLGGAGTVFIGGSRLTQNRADSGILAYVNSGDSHVTTVEFEAVQIDGNGLNGIGDYNDLFLFFMNGVDPFYSGLRLSRVTIADNNVADTLILNMASNVSMHSSIVQDDGYIYSEFIGGTSQFDCVLSHELDSLLNVTRSAQTNSPGFVDSENDDYHILQGSIAQDFCDSSPLINMPDIDGDEWGFDDPNQLDVYGSYDVGIDEIRFNTAAVANADNFVILEDAISTEFDVLANDFDADGDAFVVESILVLPTQGELILEEGLLSYTPDLNFCGIDEFEYLITGGDSSVATITVECVNDQPTFTSLSSLKIALDDLNKFKPKTVACEFDMGPEDEDISQSLLLFDVEILEDNAGVLNNVVINQQGQLIPDFSGNAGTVLLSLTMQDDGGVANNGIDMSDSHILEISVKDYLFVNGFENESCQ